jgi:glucosamine--fructose-6-phosphate aminotransferase (isomerizing)
MCGIVGIISKKENVVEKTMNGLQQLEYRGYDSAGITIIKQNKFETIKSVGKISNLKDKIVKDFVSHISIAHTRWATHGGVSVNNAHPHTSCKNDITIVHNGIIENYGELKNKLIKNNFTFSSGTDSEVICNLVSYNLSRTKNIEEAFFESLKEFKGSYGIALIYNKEPDKLFIAKNGSPLIIGIGEDENLVASSIVAFSGITNKIIQMCDNQVAVLTSNSVNIFDMNRKNIIPVVDEIKIDDFTADKGDFEYFMLKEIYETPEVFKRTIKEYIDVENNEIIFPKFNFDLAKIDFLTVVACGTSYHAACVAKYFIEELAEVFVNVDIASEFRYKSNPLKENGLALFISQSGETADTNAALKYCRERKQKIVSLVNVVQSTIANASDVILRTVAGVEVAVASTKAFTAQIAVLYLLGLEMAKQKNKITVDEYHKKIKDFVDAIDVLKSSINDNLVKNIKDTAKELAKTKHLVYIGRDIFFPMALEGALKVKEISYLPTLGVASGELKHGTLALIDSDTFVIALNNSNLLFDKNISSMEEIVARNGKIVLICDDENIGELKQKIFKFIRTSKTKNKFEILLSSIIPLQLLAYYVGTERGYDVDRPRNLAKSVTVE